MRRIIPKWYLITSHQKHLSISGRENVQETSFIATSHAAVVKSTLCWAQREFGSFNGFVKILEFDINFSIISFHYEIASTDGTTIQGWLNPLKGNTFHHGRNIMQPRSQISFAVDVWQ
jgi:hypothetical protein